MAQTHSSTLIHLRAQTPEIVAIGLSHRGQVRAANEDSLILDAEGHFFLLADGMGGHERGAEASATALEIISSHLTPHALGEEINNATQGSRIPPQISGLGYLVEQAVEQANAFLYRKNQKEQLRRFMGTTLVGLCPLPDGYVLWFHVGDSRLYRCRNSVLTCLTEDHSVHAAWLRSGRVGKEPGKQAITRAVGPMPSVITDIGWEKWQKDDTYLLCSDGLSDMLGFEEIEGILLEKDADACAQKLVEAANAAGGRDNISVILCKF